MQSIHQGEVLEKIGELIDKSLTKNEQYLDFHTNNQFKYYTFNSLFKTEVAKVFEEGGIYSIKIRTVDEQLAEYFTKSLAHEYTEYIKSLTTEIRTLKPRMIDQLYSITPILMKTDKGYWKGNLSLEDYEMRIKINLIKKYNQFFNTKLNEDFQLFTRIEFNNHKPIAVSYKNIHLLGDKLTLYIAENDTAQKLAFFALGAGIGEMGSRGFGFMNYKPM